MGGVSVLPKARSIAECDGEPALADRTGLLIEASARLDGMSVHPGAVGARSGQGDWDAHGNGFARLAGQQEARPGGEDDRRPGVPPEERASGTSSGTTGGDRGTRRLTSSAARLRLRPCQRLHLTASLDSRS